MTSIDDSKELFLYLTARRDMAAHVRSSENSLNHYVADHMTCRRLASLRMQVCTICLCVCAIARRLVATGDSLAEAGVLAFGGGASLPSLLPSPSVGYT